MKKKRNFSGLNAFMCSAVTLALSASISSTVQASAFADTSGHWAEAAITRWASYDVIAGYNGYFRPDDPITRGDMAVIINRIMDYQIESTRYYSDLDETYYTSPIRKLNSAGFMEGFESTIRPKDYITREEAAVVIANAMHLDVRPTTDGTYETTFTDNYQIAYWAKNSIYMLNNLGALNGRSTNYFEPQVNITRAEVAYALDKLIEEFIYTQEGYSINSVNGTVVINEAGVSLENMTIEGNLILAEGIADGDIYLDNVVVKGNIIIKGGSTNTVYVDDVTCNGRMEVSRVDAATLVKIRGSSKIPTIDIYNDCTVDGSRLDYGNELGDITIYPDAQNVTILGNVDSVTNESPGCDITLGGNFGSVDMNQQGTVNDTAYSAGSKVDVNKIPSTTADLAPGIYINPIFPNSYASAFISVSDPTIDVETGEVEVFVYVSSVSNCDLMSVAKNAITLTDGQDLTISVEDYEAEESFGTTVYKVNFTVARNVERVELDVNFSLISNAPDITVDKNFDEVDSTKDPSASVKITEIEEAEDGLVTMTLIVSHMEECRLPLDPAKAVTIKPASGKDESDYPEIVVVEGYGSTTTLTAYQISFYPDEDQDTLPLQVNFLDSDSKEDFSDVKVNVTLNYPGVEDGDDEPTAKYEIKSLIDDLDAGVTSFRLQITDMEHCELPEDDALAITCDGEDELSVVTMIDTGTRRYFYVSVPYDEDRTEMDIDVNFLDENANGDAYTDGDYQISSQGDNFDFNISVDDSAEFQMHGGVKLDGGEVVTLTPLSGETIYSVQILGDSINQVEITKNSDGSWTFTMPENDIILYVSNTNVTSTMKILKGSSSADFDVFLVNDNTVVDVGVNNSFTAMQYVYITPEEGYIFSGTPTAVDASGNAVAMTKVDNYFYAIAPTTSDVTVTIASELDTATTYLITTNTVGGGFDVRKATGNGHVTAVNSNVEAGTRLYVYPVVDNGEIAVIYAETRGVERLIGTSVAGATIGDTPTGDTKYRIVYFSAGDLADENYDVSYKVYLQGLGGTNVVNLDSDYVVFSEMYGYPNVMQGVVTIKLDDYPGLEWDGEQLRSSTVDIVYDPSDVAGLTVSTNAMLDSYYNRLTFTFRGQVTGDADVTFVVDFGDDDGQTEAPEGTLSFADQAIINGFAYGDGLPANMEVDETAKTITVDVGATKNFAGETFVDYELQFEPDVEGVEANWHKYEEDIFTMGYVGTPVSDTELTLILNFKTEEEDGFKVTLGDRIESAEDGNGDAVTDGGTVAENGSITVFPKDPEKVASVTAIDEDGKRYPLDVNSDDKSYTHSPVTGDVEFEVIYNFDVFFETSEVTIAANTGVLTTSGQTALENTQITIIPKPVSGKVVDYVTANGVKLEEKDGSYSHLMTEDVTIKVVYVGEEPEVSNKITLKTDGDTDNNTSKVTITGTTVGVITPDSTEVKEGEFFTVAVESETHTATVKVTKADGTEVPLVNNVYQMPNEAVTVTVTYTELDQDENAINFVLVPPEINGAIYSLTVDGIAQTDGFAGKEGELVAVTVAPMEGYSLKVSVTSGGTLGQGTAVDVTEGTSGANQTVSFKMPAETIYITLTYTPDFTVTYNTTATVVLGETEKKPAITLENGKATVDLSSEELTNYTLGNVTPVITPVDAEDSGLTVKVTNVNVSDTGVVTFDYEDDRTNLISSATVNFVVSFNEVNPAIQFTIGAEVKDTEGDTLEVSLVKFDKVYGKQDVSIVTVSNLDGYTLKTVTANHGSLTIDQENTTISGSTITVPVTVADGFSSDQAIITVTLEKIPEERFNITEKENAGNVASVNGETTSPWTAVEKETVTVVVEEKEGFTAELKVEGVTVNTTTTANTFTFPMPATDVVLEVVYTEVKQDFELTLTPSFVVQDKDGQVTNTEVDFDPTTLVYTKSGNNEELTITSPDLAGYELVSTTLETSTTIAVEGSLSGTNKIFVKATFEDLTENVSDTVVLTLREKDPYAKKLTLTPVFVVLDKAGNPATDVTVSSLPATLEYTISETNGELTISSPDLENYKLVSAELGNSATGSVTASISGSDKIFVKPTFGTLNADVEDTVTITIQDNSLPVLSLGTVTLKNETGTADFDANVAKITGTPEINEYNVVKITLDKDISADHSVVNVVVNGSNVTVLTKGFDNNEIYITLDSKITADTTIDLDVWIEEAVVQTYEITNDDGLVTSITIGGTAETSAQPWTAAAGTQVTLETTEPAAGNKIVVTLVPKDTTKEEIVVSSNSSGVFLFSMPGYDVDILVTEEQDTIDYEFSVVVVDDEGISYPNSAYYTKAYGEVDVSIMFTDKTLSFAGYSVVTAVSDMDGVTVNAEDVNINGGLINFTADVTAGFDETATITITVEKDEVVYYNITTATSGVPDGLFDVPVYLGLTSTITDVVSVGEDLLISPEYNNNYKAQAVSITNLATGVAETVQLTNSNFVYKMAHESDILITVFYIMESEERTVTNMSVEEIEITLADGTAEIVAGNKGTTTIDDGTEITISAPTSITGKGGEIDYVRVNGTTLTEDVDDGYTYIIDGVTTNIEVAYKYSVVFTDVDLDVYVDNTEITTGDLVTPKPTHSEDPSGSTTVTLSSDKTISSFTYTVDTGSSTTSHTVTDSLSFTMPYGEVEITNVVYAYTFTFESNISSANNVLRTGDSNDGWAPLVGSEVAVGEGLQIVVDTTAATDYVVYTNVLSETAFAEAASTGNGTNVDYFAIGNMPTHDVVVRIIYLDEFTVAVNDTDNPDVPVDADYDLSIRTENTGLEYLKTGLSSDLQTSLDGLLTDTTDPLITPDEGNGGSTGDGTGTQVDGKLYWTTHTAPVGAKVFIEPQEAAAVGDYEDFAIRNNSGALIAGNNNFTVAKGEKITVTYTKAKEYEYNASSISLTLVDSANLNETDSSRITITPVDANKFDYIKEDTDSDYRLVTINLTDYEIDANYFHVDTVVVTANLTTDGGDVEYQLTAGAPSYNESTGALTFTLGAGNLPDGLLQPDGTNPITDISLKIDTTFQRDVLNSATGYLVSGTVGIDSSGVYTQSVNGTVVYEGNNEYTVTVPMLYYVSRGNYLLPNSNVVVATTDSMGEVSGTPVHDTNNFGQAWDTVSFTYTVDPAENEIAAVINYGHSLTTRDDSDKEIGYKVQANTSAYGNGIFDPAANTDAGDHGDVFVKASDTVSIETNDANSGFIPVVTNNGAVVPFTGPSQDSTKGEVYSYDALSNHNSNVSLVFSAKEDIVELQGTQGFTATVTPTEANGSPITSLGTITPSSVSYNKATNEATVTFNPTVSNNNYTVVGANGALTVTVGSVEVPATLTVNNNGTCTITFDHASLDTESTLDMKVEYEVRTVKVTVSIPTNSALTVLVNETELVNTNYIEVEYGETVTIKLTNDNDYASFDAIDASHVSSIVGNTLVTEVSGFTNQDGEITFTLVGTVTEETNVFII